MLKFNLLFAIQFFFIFCCFSQNLEKELYLKHSVKQDSESFHFFLLANDEKGLNHYNNSKYYYWYKTQKVMSTQGGSSGSLLNGKFEAFYENKQLSKIGTFKKGLKNGEWKYWREDGSLIRVENWKRGKLCGKEVIYDEKGQIIVTTNYSCRSISRQTSDSIIITNYSGTKKSISIFDEKGDIISTQRFKDGIEVETTKKKISLLFNKKENNVEESNKKDA
jgi:antitoxin component YwqK of YwqJK toxin-antitoxin module